MRQSGSSGHSFPETRVWHSVDVTPATGMVLSANPASPDPPLDPTVRGLCWCPPWLEQVSCEVLRTSPALPVLLLCFCLLCQVLCLVHSSCLCGARCTEEKRSFLLLLSECEALWRGEPSPGVSNNPSCQSSGEPRDPIFLVPPPPWQSSKAYAPLLRIIFECVLL